MKYYSSIKRTYKIVVYIFLYELRKGEDVEYMKRRLT